MARPKIIEELHGARYDWLMAPLEEKAKMKARFDELRTRAAKEFGCDEISLWDAVSDDYQLWRRQQGLPKPPSKTD